MDYNSRFENNSLKHMPRRDCVGLKSMLILNFTICYKIVLESLQQLMKVSVSLHDFHYFFLPFNSEIILYLQKSCKNIK